MNITSKAHSSLSMNQRLQMAGIETDYLEYLKWETYFLIYEDKCIPRPLDADQAPKVCLKHFGIII